MSHEHESLHPDDCAGGMLDDLAIRPQLADGADTATVDLQLKIENNTPNALDVGLVVQVVDLTGEDVVTPALLADVAVSSESSVDDSEGVPVDLNSVADGYYSIQITALALNENGDEIAGQAIVFIRRQAGVVEQIEEHEWYFNSGAAEYTTPT